MVTITIDASKSLDSDDSTSKLDYFTCCMMIGFLKSTQFFLRYSIVVSVMDSYCMRSGFKPRPRQTHIRYALNNIQFISDESSAELVLYLCE